MSSFYNSYGKSTKYQMKPRCDQADFERPENMIEDEAHSIDEIAYNKISRNEYHDFEQKRSIHLSKNVEKGRNKNRMSPIKYVPIQSYELNYRIDLKPFKNKRLSRLMESPQTDQSQFESSFITENPENKDVEKQKMCATAKPTSSFSK